MSNGFIGERMTDNTTPRLFRMPPAGAGYLANGQFLDSGAAMILDSNLSHLEWASIRHLVTDLGPGHLPLKNDAGWGGLHDGSAPAAGDSSRSGAAGLSWSQRVARRYGPFFIPEDRQDMGGFGSPPTLPTLRPVIRAIKFNVQCSSPFGALQLAFALTASSAPPDRGYIAFTGAHVPAAPPSAILLANAPVPTTPRTSRPDPSTGWSQSTPVEVWAWVGWFGDDNDVITGISLYELRT